MHRTEGANNVSNLYTAGPPATTVTAESMNSIQEEIVNVVEGAGLQLLTASTDTRDQLLTAIQALVASYDFIVTSQSTFENIIERTGANTYQIKDDYKSVLFKNITGGYAISGILSGGDTWGDIETNNCADIEFESGAYLYFANLAGQLTVNTDDCHLKNVWVKGAAGVAAAITNSFELNAYRVTFNNCKASTRLSNTAMIGFEGSGTDLHDVTSKYINCSVFDLESSGDLRGFSDCDNISNGLVYNLECTSTGICYGIKDSSNILNCMIRNLDSDSGDTRGMHDTNRISTCKIHTLDSNSGDVYGIHSCDMISACVVLDLDSTSGDIYGMHTCNSISSSWAIQLTTSGTVVGFASCGQVSACYADDIDSSGAGANGFLSCNYISSCKATNITGTAASYGFNSCDYGAAIYTNEASNPFCDWMDSGDAQITNNYSVESFFT